MPSKKTPLYAKFLLSFFSLIFFLTLLEVGLWAVGKMYYQNDEEYRTDEVVDTDAGGQTVDIIAVGDSFTHGGMVEGHETYTAHLRELLSQNHVRGVRVFNQGICELNTQELVQRFPGMVAKYHPKAVLLLVGATNRFNPWAYEAYANKNSLSWLKNQFFELRVVKMARFIKLSLMAREDEGAEFQKKNMIMRNLKTTRSVFTRHDSYMDHIGHWEGIEKPHDYDFIEQAWYLFNAGNAQKAIELVEHSLDTRQVSPIEGPLALVHFYFKSGNLEKAEEVLHKTHAMYPQSELLYNSLAYYYFEFAKWYKAKLKYDAAIDYYLQAIAIEPDADYFFSELNKLYDLQSHYDSKAIYERLKAMQQKNPLLAMSTNFTVNLNLYRDKQKWDAGIEQWIYDDLSDIARMCEKKHIRLFIQKYPTDYAIANRVLERIASEYDLPVIDHQAVFDPLEPKDKYFFDDDHCTNEGHKIMARTIYEALDKDNMIRM